MNKFRRHYEVAYSWMGSKTTRHQWTVHDPASRCAVHLWISDYGVSGAFGRTDGGVEYHYSVPMDGWATKVGEPCRWTGGDCWHAGGSTVADRFRRDFEDCRDQRCEFDPPWAYLEARLAEVVAEVAALKAKAGGGA